MWLCWAFQSLSPTALGDFLSAGTPITWAGLQLNVAPPLWQRLPHETVHFTHKALNRQAFMDFLFSEDPTLRQRAEILRNSYQDLRNSPEGFIRKYYFEQHMELCRLGTQGSQLKKAEKNARFLRDGERTDHSILSSQLESVIWRVSLCGPKVTWVSSMTKRPSSVLTRINMRKMPRPRIQQVGC
ncbi:hypothetical protein BJY01DRAFT_116083 [Aspergillus pseudoustus]|uniref:Uncharacterized protein n=1 Tax=Aspergillus pseudoustus TaxID=1810923 RepID=A0ABR4L026_9EURO